MGLQNDIAIITDTDGDFSQEVYEGYPIFTLPLILRQGEQEYKDGINITVEDVYRRQPKEDFKTSLPSMDDVEMILDQIRAESKSRKGTENCFGEISIALDLKQRVIRIDFLGVEELHVVDEIILYSFHLCLEESHIHGMIIKIHVEAGDIFHLVLHVLVHAVISWHDHPDIIVFLVDIAWK